MSPWKASTVALTLALGIIVGGSIIPTAVAGEQPHMQSAREHLKAAKRALESASHDHGGHRAKALKATEHAIHEVEEGIAWAEKHPGPKGDGPGPKGDGPGPKGGGPTPKGGGPTPK
jgi:hypothetical protein